jgi:O-antigen ligase
MMFVVLGALVPLGGLIAGWHARERGHPRNQVWRRAAIGALLGAALAVVLVVGLAILVGIALSEMDDGVFP